jgi:DNA-binding transcriptional regulator YiaG
MNEIPASPCSLYRHFDAAGQLLYVGISLSALRRLGEHERGSQWYESIANVTVEQFSSRAEAEQAEIYAIRNEKPLHNKAHRTLDAVQKPRIAMQGSDLKAIRQQLGMSQAEFAEALDMTGTFIGLMERGERPIERRTEMAALYLQMSEGGTLTPVPMPPPTRVVDLGVVPAKRVTRVKGKVE